eukprot:PhF_6_TR4339/c0_g1_i3/m.5846
MTKMKDNKRHEANLLKKLGWKADKIAEYLNVSVSTVYRGLKDKVPRQKKTNLAYMKRRSILQAIVNKRVLVAGIRHPAFCSASEIGKELSRRLGTEVSRWTVRRDLKQLGFKCYVRKRVPSRCPLVLSQKKAFARKWKGVPQSKCQQIVFSDEHTVSVNDHTCKIMYAISLDGVVPRQRCRLQNIPRRMVWAAVGHNYKSKIVIFAPKFRQTSDTYVRKCLQVVAPQLTAGKRLFIQDNARPHVTQQVKNYLLRKDVELLSFPPYSPEMNMIEYIWPVLNRRVADLHPVTDADLVEAIEKAWESITQHEINAIVKHFQTKCLEHARSKND